MHYALCIMHFNSSPSLRRATKPSNLTIIYNSLRLAFASGNGLGVNKVNLCTNSEHRTELLGDKLLQLFHFLDAAAGCQ